MRCLMDGSQLDELIRVKTPHHTVKRYQTLPNTAKHGQTSWCDFSCMSPVIVQPSQNNRVQKTVQPK